ncbi:MAG TPA: ABC transporter substrate-binding protein [Candidatus Saccharimonadales bacterium]|nr:ABC transporter substrate-binding protein [Candidatus Saccharimonadales bacterium]
MNQYSEGIVGQPRSFFPSQAQTQNDKTISRLIYRGLFKYDIYGTLVPDLADTWEISSDGITYTIKLKDNQYWSDGTKITSDDLIYSAFKIQNLSGVATDKVDSLTVRYTLPNKFSPFLSLLTVGVMKSNSEENDTPLQPISSGPFRIVRVQKSGPVVSSVTLVHNNSAENIRRLNFRYYANQDELTTAAKLGEIEGFISTKKEDLANFSERRFPLEGVYYALFFNLRNPKLKDQLLRQKLQKVLPLHDLTIDLGIPVEGAISRSIFTDKALNFDAYDKLFSEQIPDLTVTLTVPDIPEHVSLANQIKMFWKDKLGINVLINKVDPSKINDQVIKSRNFEVLLYGQEVSLDPDRYINWHSTQADYPGLNLSAFSQVRADRALEEGRNEIDNDKRVVHYNEFQKVMVDQVPAIFLYHPYIKYYVSKYIDGIGEKYTSTLADRFLDFDNWHRIKTN